MCLRILCIRESRNAYPIAQFACIHIPSLPPASFLKFRSNLPGPGTYGKDGIPWAAMEEKAKMSTSTVGMLDAGSTNLRHRPTTGSDLAPGRYKQVSPIQQLLQKSVSKRGPYDTFTGERYKPQKSLVSVGACDRAWE